MRVCRKVTFSVALIVCAALAGALAGCEEPKSAAPLPVRAIKYMTVKARAADQVRRISGVVEAGTVTDLSFEVSGQVNKISVDIGDHVAAGAPIAMLDSEPYRLKVDTARGELGRAQAQLKDARQKFSQQQKLYKSGFTTKTKFDTATANLKSAESQLSIARTKLSIAERDLRKTALKAPFRGRISQKYVDQFTEVAAGQRIVQIHTEGDMKVEASVPESLVRELKTGSPVTVYFPTLGNLKSGGKIEDIGSRAGTANAFPVKISLDRQFPELRPGMSAEVALRFSTKATGTAFLLPLAAVLPEGKRRASIFVYDKKQGVVRKRKIQVVNVRDNDLEVTGELKEGDIVAIAGVSFLADNMKVRLMGEK